MNPTRGITNSTRVVTPGGVELPKKYAARRTGKPGFNPPEPGRLRWFFAGVGGSGKSTFAASFPKACVLDFIDKMTCIPHWGKGTERFTLASWDDYKSLFEDLLADGESGKRYFDTIIFDLIEAVVSKVRSEKSDEFSEADLLSGRMPIKDLTRAYGQKGAGWDVVYQEIIPLFSQLYEAGYGIGVLSQLHPKYVGEGDNQRLTWKYGATPKIVEVVHSFADFSGLIQADTESKRVPIQKKVVRGGKTVMVQDTKVIEVTTHQLVLSQFDPKVNTRQPVQIVRPIIELPEKDGYKAFFDEYEASCEAKRARLSEAGYKS